MHARHGVFPVLTALAALTLASHALAATTPPGANLRWDSCYDDGGAANKAFACDTNTGLETLVMSFALDTPMADVSGVEIWLEFVSQSASLPDWWRLFNAGTCRQAAISMNTTTPPLATNCVDWAQGQSAGGIGAYQIGFFGPNTVRMGLAVAVPAASLEALAPGQEYFMANLRFSHAKTVGAGACAGCDIPVCMVFSQLRITTPVFANNRSFASGANGVASQLATWQNGLPVNPHLDFSTNLGGNFTRMDGCSLAATGARNSTWGAVKALYR
jgi:hypothetical protein